MIHDTDMTIFAIILRRSGSYSLLYRLYIFNARPYSLFKFKSSGGFSLLKCISLGVIIINARNVNASIYIMKCTLNDFLSLNSVYHKSC